MAPIIAKPHVLLLQLPVPNNPALNTPLAAGYLKAYAAAQGLLEQFAIEILPRAIADHAGDAALVAAIVARQPDLLGISLYTWNSERSLAIALRVKERLPNLVVLVGGPEVQADNQWVIDHPAVDHAIVGEGEQAFVQFLRSFQTRNSSLPISILQAPTANLQDLSVLPSPYLEGYLELSPDGMQMIEISRWCPYSCSFCLYGRNMGPKLGSRYFGLERVLAEIAWGKKQGVRRVHFVEANLNLVPLFWPLMHALADLNADKQLTFYAELRGEHLSDAVVAALDAANVRVVEVGLQTANPVALRASKRRTDLGKWAAGTRRLYEYNIEVLLDVILGLPADDVAGVAATLDFLDREELGTYDIFTLQVLPGTAVRAEAAQYGLQYQDRPPYYVLATDRMSYRTLQQQRRELKIGAGLEPDVIEGMPLPRALALNKPASTTDNADGTQIPADLTQYVTAATLAELPLVGERLASHVDMVLQVSELAAATPALAAAIAANPSTIFDLYLLCAGTPPGPPQLRAWREELPFTPGYLDRVAVYLNELPDPSYQRVSPRLFLVLPWEAPIDPEAYHTVAEIIWAVDVETRALLAKPV
jgi:hypothetical protein